jgi:hypothetical protein
LKELAQPRERDFAQNEIRIGLPITAAGNSRNQQKIKQIEEIKKKPRIRFSATEQAVRAGNGRLVPC